METPDSISQKIIKVQSLYSDAMDKLNYGDYHSALLRFDEAKDSCGILIPFLSGEHLVTIQNILDKCNGQCEQIQQYIESSDEINLTESQYLSNSSIYRESELGGESMLFPALNREVMDESTINAHWGGYLWDKVEVLLKLLHPYAEQLQQYQHDPAMNSPKREDITMDSSFILVPKEESSQRISLNDPVVHTVDPSVRIKELETKLACVQQQLDQTKKIVQPKGVSNLMNENTKLKKSIIDFSNHLQKHNNFRKAMTISAHENKPSGLEVQNQELLLKLAGLEKELLKKDKQIDELLDYKEKWLNLKKEASARKKQRESSVSPTSMNDSESTKILLG